MIGHAYFDRAFSARFRKILEAEYDLPQTRDKLWEDLYVEHIKELDMSIRKYDPPIIREFDSLDELRDFDPLFLDNLDSEIFDNICAVLGCEKSEIRDVYPLKQGITNLSCHFSTDDGEWVYRHPGVGTELMIDRKAEKIALETAAKLGLDSTFVFESPRARLEDLAVRAQLQEPRRPRQRPTEDRDGDGPQVARVGGFGGKALQLLRRRALLREGHPRAQPDQRPRLGRDERAGRQSSTTCSWPTAASRCCATTTSSG